MHFPRHFLNLHRNYSAVWKGLWRRDFRIVITLPQESTLTRNNGETGMIQYRNITLEVVVFGPLYFAIIVTRLHSSVQWDGWMDDPTHLT
jgi:hypothetical protein